MNISDNRTHPITLWLVDDGLCMKDDGTTEWIKRKRIKDPLLLVNMPEPVTRIKIY